MIHSHSMIFQKLKSEGRFLLTYIHLKMGHSNLLPQTLPMVVKHRQSNESKKNLSSYSSTSTYIYIKYINSSILAVHKLKSYANFLVFGKQLYIHVQLYMYTRTHLLLDSNNFQYGRSQTNRRNQEKNRFSAPLIVVLGGSCGEVQMVYEALSQMWIECSN